MSQSGLNAFFFFHGARPIFFEASIWERGRVVGNFWTIVHLICCLWDCVYHVCVCLWIGTCISWLRHLWYVMEIVMIPGKPSLLGWSCIWQNFPWDFPFWTKVWPFSFNSDGALVGVLSFRPKFDHLSSSLMRHWLGSVI